MSAWQRAVSLFDNPLIVKDAVSRMRSWRAPVVLTLYLGLLAAFGYSIFLIEAINLAGSHTGAAQIGGLVFSYLTFFQLTLVSLFAPALAAGAVSGERERQTFDVLLVSRVTALGIVWGKLVASVAFMLLLILGALPLFAAVFLFGGIDFEQFVVTQLLTASTAVTIGAISVFLSSAFRRTLPSTVTAYGCAFAGLVGALLVGSMLTILITERQVSADVHPFEFTNPLYAIWVVLDSPNGAAMHLGRLLQLLVLAPGPANSAGPSLEPWQGTLLAQLMTIGLCVFGAVRLVGGHRAAQPRVRTAEDPLELEGAGRGERET
jgi:ABC-type transport system involved in multi-copper enzyme maturation permease subunit